MAKKRFSGFFSGARGQRVFNILYSIGASIVILGALFKLLHWTGADTMLIIGMGTEALIFFLSAFDEKQMGSGEEMVQGEGFKVHGFSPSGSSSSKAGFMDQDDSSANLNNFPKSPEDIEELYHEIERMNENMKKLNAAYERMLKAMKDE